ncbi:MAG TPA: host attachment protein [Gammaproteobacteria bacterium]|nr:host attachment protein [Gammaproteobacteria bacterium]
MNTTWILVADRSSAKLFESRGKAKGLQRLQEIPHPEGRLKNQDIDSDTDVRARSFDSVGMGRHATSPHQEPTKTLAGQFAHHLAELLNKGRTSHAYQQLVLVAEPGFLGLLRGALDTQTAGLVVESVTKDLMHVEDRDLPNHLKGF